MKFKGKTLSGRIVLPYTIHRNDEAVVLNLTSLPFGWEADVRSNFLVEPTPPTRAVKDDKTGMHAKDANGRVRFEEDENDPDYLREVAAWWRRLRAVMVFKMLSADPDFDSGLSEPTSGKAQDWIAFADQLNQGFSENHFSDAELGTIVGLAGLLAGAQDSKRVYDDFLLSLDGKKKDQTASSEASSKTS